MNRRDFLQSTAALGGLALLAPRGARASSKYDGPFFVTIQAGGGWDPTLLCDPKGGAAGNRETVNQRYTPDQILTSGNIRVAPTAYSIDVGGGTMFEVYSAKKFFDAWGSRFVVVNGVDTATNNHDTGSRTVLAGRGADDFPNIAALAAAAAYGTTPAPMAYLSYGGYDGTGGLVPLTRASNVDNLWRVAYPNRNDAKNPASGTYLSPDTFLRVQAAQAARTGRLVAKEPMPAMRRALSTLIASRSGDTGLADIANYLPSKAAGGDDLRARLGLAKGSSFGDGDIEGFMRQAQLALASFQAGVGIGASLVMGGFDTHGDHDNSHTPQLMRLMFGVSFLMDEAQKAGLLDKLYVLVGSDFGRTPYYNAGNGKDHWAVTSMLVAGPGITGGRVVGSTNDGFMPDAVNASLQPDANGFHLTPDHVHAALRQVAGLTGSDAAKQYPVTETLLPILA
ncbi:MAG: hypothetical protein RL199_1869 [Pseudomonadota bacterium]|jgi:uncharacterized protein (DUF1501 family)